MKASQGDLDRLRALQEATAKSEREQDKERSSKRERVKWRQIKEKEKTRGKLAQQRAAQLQKRIGR